MKSLLAFALLTVLAASPLFSQQQPSPDPAVTPRADWQTYPAGKLPRGTNVTEAEVAKLADGGEVGQVLYLVGSFTVTARAEDRVVLRSGDKPGPIRVVAVYPRSIPTPAEGAAVVRDETRGFLVTGVRRGRDGQITVYVRDITAP